MKALKYKNYNLKNFHTIPQIEKLSKEEKFNLEVVGNVLPFKVNNYVINELINWDNYQNDPVYNMTFPKKEMLLPHHFDEMKASITRGDQSHSKAQVRDKIRLQLNPSSSGEIEHNVPLLNGVKLNGIQHKYRETVLFFPKAGQTCHSYCTYCFRWTQFSGMKDLTFAMKETDVLVQYLETHNEVTDLLITGGDPMIMSFSVFEKMINTILSRLKYTNIQTIRIGTKSLSYWPYKFVTDFEADAFLRLFEKITSAGVNLSIMAHFSHPSELKTEIVKAAIIRLRNTGAQIRTQTPLLRHINDKPELWSEMWREQVNLNCIPYYMFIARNTGAQHYFSVPLAEALNIFRNAYQKVSGVCRTVRGPIMSCTPGKIQVLGITEINDENAFVLRFIQGRNPDWIARPFFAKFDNTADWINQLRPMFNEQFFFEHEESAYSKLNVNIFN